MRSERSYRRYCPECDTSIGVSSAFCKSCGADLRVETITAKVTDTVSYNRIGRTLVRDATAEEIGSGEAAFALCSDPDIPARRLYSLPGIGPVIITVFDPIIRRVPSIEDPDEIDVVIAPEDWFEVGLWTSVDVRAVDRESHVWRLADRGDSA